MCVVSPGTLIVHWQTTSQSLNVDGGKGGDGDIYALLPAILDSTHVRRATRSIIEFSDASKQSKLWLYSSTAINVLFLLQVKSTKNFQTSAATIATFFTLITGASRNNV